MKVSPDYARALLEARPTSGQGVHLWLFRAAKALHPLYPDKNELARLLSAACSGCGREVPNTEILNAIRNSDPAEESASGGRERQLRWPAQNPAHIVEIVQQGPTAAELQVKSPVGFEDGRDSRSEEIVDVLFPGNPNLCAAIDKKYCSTLPREEWRGLLDRQQFIVPSPMSETSGKTKAGKPSPRGLENTGPRRFLVIEFDPPKWDTLPQPQQEHWETEGIYYQVKRDEQAALLWHLADFGPLAAVVFSGSKSLHSWFYCEGKDETALHRFMRYAVSLGADHATWTKNQLVRMPDGRRDNGKLQTTIYLNPEALK